ncbi:MAG: C-GCAxxG-C-C family (seleno)protein [Planctomycetota bacterium]|jgi:hypothetical protein
MNVADRAFGHPQKLEEKAVEPLAGGITQYGYQCGMLWGASLAAGAEAFRRFGPGPKAEAAAIRTSQRLVEAFQARFKEINCLEVTETRMQDAWGIMKFFLKGGPVLCVRMIAKFGPEAVRVIDAALSEEPVETVSGPVSCTSELARKLGATEEHAVMAAGLAAGIGLSGGGCGALGAAIWIIGMQGRESGLEKKVIDARIKEATERFLKASDHEFECSEIVGRKFEDVADHAGHVHGGGCSKIIEALAGGNPPVALASPQPGVAVQGYSARA